MQAEPQAIRPANSGSPPILKILLGIMLVMFPIGFYIMFSDAGKEYLWTTTIFLGLEALITFIVLLHIADTVSAVITSAMIIAASYFAEWWGVNTGFPFGNYSYTDILLPHINGVPAAITFAWFVVTVNSFLSAKYLLGRSPAYALVAVSSAFILASDILLEPFASFVNGYWLWDSASIPMQNFVSWLVLGILFSIALASLLKWKDESEIRGNIYIYPVIIMCVNILNFALVNIVNGYYALSITGLLILSIIAIVSVKSRVKPV